MVRTLFVLALSLMFLGGAWGQTKPVTPATPAEVRKFLQVPSPEWRDQVIYFVMPDRFFDGNPANSDQQAGEYDPNDGAKYSGGDLAGVTKKLDYIKGLGMTTLWITPPVANQWWDPQVQYGGYHGYWAENFSEVDKHMGTLDDYRTLSASLHKNGMYLIQDIVPNHVGNFFHFDGETYTANPGSVPVTKPTQKPFDRNDYNNPADRKADIYHWTPPIADYNNPTQALTYQLADLDDLNTENPVVAAALKDSFGFWIRDVGVDGFRIDTVRYVPHAFWNDFHWSKDRAHPGIIPFSQAVGKKNFLTFGEDWETTLPYDDRADTTMVKYLGTPSAPEMTTVLNFPLQSDLRDVFAKGRPTDILSYRLRAQARVYADPSLLVNFIDNHDMDRFSAGADPASLRQALLFLFTVPGIPVLYYGTEQGLTETRASMFAEGWGSGGKDRFDTDSEGYQFIRSLAKLRASERELSRGKLRVVRDAGSAGAFAYTVAWNDRTALVAFNTASNALLIDHVATDLPPGTVLKRLTELNGSGDPTLTVGPGGIVHLNLAAKGGVVYAAAAVAGDTANVTEVPSINGPVNPVFTASVPVSGVVPPGIAEPRLVVAGNLENALVLNPDAQGAWSTLLPVDKLENGPSRAVLVGKKPDGSSFVAAVYPFRVELAYTVQTKWKDPVGDDKGPLGAYRYPTHASFTNQNDIETVELSTAGTSLKVTVTMAGPLSTLWGPPNGFDHVAFYLYLQVPGQASATVLPFQNGQTPAGFSWSRMAFFEGWTSRLFRAEGAAPRSYGAPASPAGTVKADKAKQQITFTFSGASLGFPASLSGIKAYLTTWDYTGLESRNRPLAPDGGDYTYTGPAEGPLIMDDTPVLTLP